VAEAAKSNQADEGWELDEDNVRSLVPHVGIIHERVQGEHIARWHPWRVLAECAAKRAMVEMYLGSSRAAELAADATDLANAITRAAESTSLAAVRLLTAVYSDHPAYDLAWRP
jgi:hypothetical protein